MCVKGLLYNLLWSIFQVRYEEEEDLWLAFMDGRSFQGILSGVIYDFTMFALMLMKYRYLIANQALAFSTKY